MTSSPRSSTTPRAFWTRGRIVIAVVAVLTLVFIFENTRRTRIRLLIPEVTMPLWLALAATALIGVICGMYWTHMRTRDR
ncbi:DUF1049 domain-containing protein [Streptomyces avicenniae]|uniref:DUF1049 domain-containing protein n=1 Tax=Streptomyces avicenniae TaxID=500153 RepID=UPI00069A2041|nr:DUF1049 domain-containing protein [Streptomyces avicenniae]